MLLWSHNFLVFALSVAILFFSILQICIYRQGSKCGRVHYIYIKTDTYVLVCK